jgi:hypothetical protein
LLREPSAIGFTSPHDHKCFVHKAWNLPSSVQGQHLLPQRHDAPVFRQELVILHPYILAPSSAELNRRQRTEMVCLRQVRNSPISGFCFRDEGGVSVLAMSESLSESRTELYFRQSSEECSIPTSRNNIKRVIYVNQLAASLS